MFRIDIFRGIIEIKIQILLACLGKLKIETSQLISTAYKRCIWNQVKHL